MPNEQQNTVRHSTFPWLALSAGMMLGMLGGYNFSRSRVEPPSVFVNATATHAGDTMALATGPIDDGTEGIFVLDFISGELQCRPVNPRSGYWSPHSYTANVATDLEITEGTQPRYLMVIGAAKF